MAKIFPVVVKRKTVVVGGGGGAADRERLTYDRPEAAPVPVDRQAVATAVRESAPVPTEVSSAAALAQSLELAPVPVETVRITATQGATEDAPVPIDAASAVIAAAVETPAAPVDTVSLTAMLAETAPVPVELATATARAIAIEAAPDAIELVALVPVCSDAAPVPTELDELTTRYQPGVATITQEAATRSDWATITNAQGQRNGTFATFAGNLLAARSGRIVGPFPAAPASITGNFMITSAVLEFYGDTQVPAGVQPTLRLGYRINTGALVELAAPGAANSTTDFTTTPISVDITSVIGGSWAAIPTIQAYAAAATPLGNTSNHRIDAFVLRVTATRTEP